MSGKPANPNLTLNQLCAGCGKGIVGENFVQKSGKTYLKCPVCKDWNYYNQEGQALPPQQYQQQPQTGWKKTPTTTFSTSGGDSAINQGIVTLGNRLNSLHEAIFGEEDSLGSFISEKFSGLEQKLDDLSSRFDVFQRDIGVSKEGAQQHQNFLLTKKRPRQKEKEEEN